MRQCICVHLLVFFTCSVCQQLRKQALEVQMTTKTAEGGGMYGRPMGIFSARSASTATSVRSTDTGASTGSVDDAERLKRAKREAKERAKEKGKFQRTLLLESGHRVDPEQEVVINEQMLAKERLRHEFELTRRSGVGYDVEVR